MTGGRDAFAARVRGDVARRVDDGALPDLSLRVAGGQRLERLLGRVARLHQVETARTVADVHHRLRRDGAHPGDRPGHDGTDLEVMRLHGDAEFAGLLVARDDRIGHARLMVARHDFVFMPSWLHLATVDITPLRNHRDLRLLLGWRLVSFFGSMITYTAVPYQLATSSPTTLRS